MQLNSETNQNHSVHFAYDQNIVKKYVVSLHSVKVIIYKLILLSYSLTYLFLEQMFESTRLTRSFYIFATFMKILKSETTVFSSWNPFIIC